MTRQGAMMYGRQIDARRLLRRAVICRMPQDGLK